MLLPNLLLCNDTSPLRPLPHVLFRIPLHPAPLFLLPPELTAYLHEDLPQPVLAPCGPWSCCGGLRAEPDPPPSIPGCCLPSRLVKAPLHRVQPPERYLDDLALTGGQQERAQPVLPLTLVELQPIPVLHVLIDYCERPSVCTISAGRLQTLAHLHPTPSCQRVSLPGQASCSLRGIPRRRSSVWMSAMKSASLRNAVANRPNPTSSLKCSALRTCIHCSAHRYVTPPTSKGLS